MIRIITLCAVVFGLSACISVRSQHGYIMETGETELTAKVGIDTKDSVLARYGAPSITPALNANTWYYVAANDNNRAFLRTKTVQREVIAFSFSVDGSVAEVKTYNIADGEEINLVDRKTPTRGKELTFLEQLVGNVGQLPNTGQESPDGGRRP